MREAQDNAVYKQQGFGQSLHLGPPFGLLIVDFVEGFADPAVFGGGNIPEAIVRTRELLDLARARRWPVAHSRIVYADDDSDANVFSAKVPGMLTLKENAPASAIVSSLRPRDGELVVRKNVPSAFFGTMLAPWLTQRGVRSLVVAGCVTSGCVRASVVDAMCWGFAPVVASDCVGDRATGPHDASLFDMSQKYAEVVSFENLLSQSGVAA